MKELILQDEIGNDYQAEYMGQETIAGTTYDIFMDAYGLDIWKEQ